MRQLPFFFVWIFTISLSAQDYAFENILDVPEFIQMKANPLHGGTCDNKVVVPVSLPAEAKGFFYSVTFAPKSKKLDSGEELLDDVLVLSKQYPLEEIDDHIMPTRTKRDANLYILRGKEYADSFTQCCFFYHHGKYIESKSKSGYVKNTDGETFYLGIERNSDWKGVQVKVELVAVI